jgi:exodeoxyribonuclease VII small subunit
MTAEEITTDDDVATLTYEEAVAELDHTVAELGREQDDLEKSVRTYERGLALARRCVTLLKDAQARLDRLAPPNPIS